jgi:transcriptional regulator GlxA family with amidase domain
MRVVILAPSGTPPLDLAGPMEVFFEAAQEVGDPHAYEVAVVGTRPGPVVGGCGFTVLPTRTIGDPDLPIDTLLVGGSPEIEPDPLAIAWIARRTPSVRRCGSVCTGTFLLAAAGLLHGRTVTTHWRYAERLAADYPDVTVDPDRIFIRDGALCTSAGATAGIDLALALVEEDFGRHVALAVARRLVVLAKRPGGQSQFSAQLAAQVSAKTPIQRAQEWIVQNLCADLSVDNLARRAGMSTRNFSRVFHLETETTPADFVEAARVEAARSLLEDTDTPLKRVAALCGFGNADVMRHAFIRRVGLGPLEYRKRYRPTYRPGKRTPSPLPNPIEPSRSRVFPMPATRPSANIYSQAA